MTSPAEIPFKSFIQIDRKAEIPVFIQIANQLIYAIQRNLLLPATKLPGTRILSDLLHVHRNTITAVYNELYAQGWVEIKPNQGTFVSAELPQHENQQKTVLTNHYPSQTGFPFRRSNLLDNPFEITRCDYVLNDGVPDVRLTQVDDIARFYSANMRRSSNRKKMGYYNQDGSEYFKSQLAHYLNLSRGLPISTNNLLITRSSEMSLFIISEILLSAEDTVVVGELSYFSANMIFQKSGAAIKTVPVDHEGIDTYALKALCEKQKIRMVYVTPHHHYPTTVSLSVQRRMELLQLANQYGFVIVEDDYDYDFRYDKQPLLPLATADTGGMVIYVGSFGKSLLPGFRTGFIVAPDNLMREMRKYLGIIDRQGDILMEQALGEMIEDGVIHRHLKKSLKIYRERRELMTDLLTENLGEYLQFEKPAGGLAFWLTWKKPMNLLKLSQQCAKSNLFIPKTILYQTHHLTGMRLGFGSMNDSEMKASTGILKMACKEFNL
ncbi:PLP-dependent aminotransferase family protein [Pseudopedobacter beijingensis]|uniref:PLP-dependent aminotransferase family protein n=1 Tax=Pseudopedobacter beijingensis TaxID=1207056 RepID=A0ABW4IAB1_9SPHI